MESNQASQKMSDGSFQNAQQLHQQSSETIKIDKQLKADEIQEELKIMEKLNIGVENESK